MKHRKSHINHNMREQGNSERRPENLRFHKLLMLGYPNDHIAMEYKIPGASIDHANVTKKIAWELDGDYHITKKGQWFKDKLREERLIKDGWRVYRIKKWKHPRLWSKHYESIQRYNI